jgi:hypothetical protein
MISSRILSIVAAIALVLPVVAPTASFAQNHNGGKSNFARGGSGAHPGGGMRPGGGGVHAGGGGYHGYHGGGGGAFIPGAIAGAVIGGAIASQTYVPSYYGPAYGYDDSAAASPPQGDDDAVAYCVQTYRSYDPGSGTYLGNDGFRHPCP